MTPQFEEIAMDRLTHLATMIKQHQDDGNYDAAILLSESAVMLTTELDAEDYEFWTVDWLGEPLS